MNHFVLTPGGENTLVNKTVVLSQEFSQGGTPPFEPPAARRIHEDTPH